MGYCSQRRIDRGGPQRSLTRNEAALGDCTMTRVDMKKIETAVAISGALGFSALGLGAGVANADQVVPKSSPIPWSQDDGDGHGWHGHGHWNDWGPGEWGPGPVGWPGGCVAATGPFGYVTGSFCV